MLMHMDADPPQLELPLSKSPTARDPISGRKKAASSGKPIPFIVNPARVRQFALDVAKRERHHAFTAVSVEFIQKIDARVRNLIREEVARHPGSFGDKRIQPDESRAMIVHKRIP